MVAQLVSCADDHAGAEIQRRQAILPRAIGVLFVPQRDDCVLAELAPQDVLCLLACVGFQLPPDTMTLPANSRSGIWVRPKDRFAVTFHVLPLLALPLGAEIGVNALEPSPTSAGPTMEAYASGAGVFQATGKVWRFADGRDFAFQVFVKK